MGASRSVPRRGLLIAAVLAVVWPTGAQAIGPENVVVVVNADSWASLTVANEFIRLRGIPESNVVYLQGLASFEQVDVETFRQRILGPVLTAIERRGLADQIDCVAWSADLPHTIDARKDLRGKKLPRMFTPVASITGVTYLHELVMARNPNYLQLAINHYMRQPIGRMGAKPLRQEDHQRYLGAMKLIGEKKWAEAEQAIAALIETYPKNNHMLYNLACCQARLGKLDEALATLTRAVDAGWLNHRHARADPDLEPLRDRDEFKRLLEQMRAVLFDVQPTRGFRSAYQWGAKGEIVPTGGRRYLLSTMLAVTSGRGNSVREALACLGRSAAADGSRPEGTIYYARNSNVRSTTRDWAFPSAVARLKALGVNAEIVEGVLPKGKGDVAGAMIGAASFDWKASGSTILPGAVCEHLTSSGGVLREGAGQTPLTELIRRGAAGASGTVTEPLAIQAKFPFAFLHVHYVRGCTLAEAFYQSVHGPYQLLIVGDPLCRPWGRVPRVTVEGVEPGATVRGRLTLRPQPADDSPVGIEHFELFVDGRRGSTCLPGRALELDTARLTDGAHELRVVAVAANVVETQGSWTAQVVVRNHGHRLVVIAPTEGEHAWDRPLKVAARLTGASEITFFHRTLPIATLPGEQGEAEVDPLRLGQGEVALHAVGVVGGVRVRSRPIRLTIVPPAPLPALGTEPGTRFAEGLLLTTDGGEPVRTRGVRVVEDTSKGDWLASQVQRGQTFELAGWFDVPEDDVYQIQLRGNVEVGVEVDGRGLKPPTSGGWAFLPVALAKGTHQLRVSGTATDKPRLDIRFGGPGSRRLSGKRFRHKGNGS